MVLLKYTDEYEDFLDSEDEKLKKDTASSNADVKAGQVSPAGALLVELQQIRKQKR